MMSFLPRIIAAFRSWINRALHRRIPPLSGIETPLDLQAYRAMRAEMAQRRNR